MPELQRAQFGLMGVFGVAAASPLLYGDVLSLTGLVTLYTVGAITIRTAVRWRAAKQLYQQQLLTYQNSNRVGSSDGALLCAARLAEQEQTKQALLLLHALTRTQAVGVAEESVSAAVESVVAHGSKGSSSGEAKSRRGAPAAASSSSAAAHSDGSWEVGELIDESRRVLRTWSALGSLEETHVSEDWRAGPLPLLISMGVVEVVDGSGSGSSRGAHAALNNDLVKDVRVRLRPMEEAVETAREMWRVLAVSEGGGLLPEGAAAKKDEEEGRKEGKRRLSDLADAFSGGGAGEGQRAAQASAGGGAPSTV